MDNVNGPDITPIAREIAALIATGADERQIFAVIARVHPEIGRREFVEALQMGTAEAERRAAAAARRH